MSDTALSPGAWSDREAELRAEIIRTCREMNRVGLNSGTAGNVSARLGDGLLITPTGMPYDLLEPGDIVRMDMQGGHAGPRRPSSEWRFHRDILRARPDLGAVVHTHSTHATALAILGQPIPAIHYYIVAAGGHDIRCAPYATFGTQDLADGVIAALDGRRACLMAHHGAIACGANLPEALDLAGTVEELARLYLLCLPNGHVPVLTAAELAEVQAQFAVYGQRSGE